MKKHQSQSDIAQTTSSDGTHH